MITKLSINQVASYETEALLKTEAPINLIYGLNGSGKTTISNYLKSQQNDSQNDLYANCTTEPSDYNGDTLCVYNQEFIDEVFFNQDIQKGIFTLSKQNKDIENQLTQKNKDQDRLAEEEKELNTNLETKNREITNLTIKTQGICFKIKQQHTGGDRILDEADFLKGFKQKAPLLSHLLTLQKTDEGRNIEDIKEDVKLLNESTGENVPELPSLTAGSEFLEIETHPIFSEVIVGSSNNTMSNLINHLGNTDWFSQGLTYLKNSEDKCPFCQQTITDQLKTEIVGYLNKAYREKTTQIANLAHQYNQLVFSIPDWSTYQNCEFIADSDQLQKGLEAVITLLGSNSKDIAAKEGAPSAIVKLQNSQGKLNEFNILINETNEKIKAHNLKLQNKASALSSLKDEFWQNQRNSYADEISTFQNSHSKLTKDADESESKLTKKRTEYQAINESIQELQKKTVNISETITNINALLKDCGLTGFNIVPEGDRHYRIVRENQNSTDKVFSSLSEGEKTMISFFYFLELCRGKSDPTETGKKIIVIDDPISSLSHMYVYNIAQLIKNEFTNVKKLKGDNWELMNKHKYSQCFILTHNLYFFYELVDMNHPRRKAMQGLYRVSKNMNGSQIVSMRYTDIQNDYQSYWSIVRDKDSHPALLANSMRNIIEYFFGFIEKKELSNVFNQLSDIKFQTFNRYINRESHSFANNIFDTKEFNHSLFQDAFKQVFEKSGYLEHYEKMSE